MNKLFHILLIIPFIAFNGCFETFPEQHQLITNENITSSIIDGCFPMEAISIDPKIAEYDSIRACLESDSVHQCEVIEKSYDWEKLYFTTDKFSSNYRIKYAAYWKKYLFDSATLVLNGKTRGGHRNVPERVTLSNSLAQIVFQLNYGDSLYYSNIVIDGKPYTQTKGIDFFGLRTTARFSDYSLSLSETVIVSGFNFGFYPPQPNIDSVFFDVPISNDSAALVASIEIRSATGGMCYVSNHEESLATYRRMKYGQENLTDFSDSYTGPVKTILYKFIDEKGTPIQFKPVFTFPYGNGSTLFIDSDSTGYICAQSGGSEASVYISSCATHTHVIR